VSWCVEPPGFWSRVQWLAARNPTHISHQNYLPLSIPCLFAQRGQDGCSWPSLTRTPRSTARARPGYCQSPSSLLQARLGSKIAPICELEAAKGIEGDAGVSLHPRHSRTSARGPRFTADGIPPLNPSGHRNRTGLPDKARTYPLGAAEHYSAIGK
jgi:hypothetical protein